MKLTNEQIERLFEFTRQHYVEWYDLQVELVDHLANGIEDRWASEPGLSFDDALHAAFKEFGVFGFMDVIEKRQKAMSGKYHALVWKHMKSFFQFPMIMATIGIVAGIFGTLSAVRYSDTIFLILVLMLMVLTVTLQLRSNYIQNRRKKDPTEKRWLYDEIIKGYGNSLVVTLFPVQLVLNIGSSSEGMFQNSLITLGASIFLAAYMIMSYVMIRVIPARAADYLEQTYPGYKLQNHSQVLI